MLDSGGLLMEGRQLDAYKEDWAWPAELAARHGWTADMPPALERVVEGLRPTMLIGTTGQPGAFTKPIVRKMAKAVERPAIFPFSNPTSKSEATPIDLMDWTEGRALVATGSPFDPVRVEGRDIMISQGNNVYIFPGIGLGALAVGARRITDHMFTEAAHALADHVTDADLESGALYPPISSLREVTVKIAIQVAEAAVSDGAADRPEVDCEELVRSWVWDPQYPELIPG